MFEIGKCYKHSSGQQMRIIGRLNTYFYGDALIGETDKGEYKPVGDKEENFINWCECEDFAKCT